jgi:hypothetical protein
MADTGTRYEPPSQPEWDRIATNPALMRALATYAGEGLALAESLAPQKSGQYRASFEVRLQVERSTGRRRGSRGVAILANTAEHAGAVEMKHKVLGRVRDQITQAK